MEQPSGVTIETFLAVSEMLAAFMRMKEADRWTATICQLKYVSFCSEFPEVNDKQFTWAAEQWLQGTISSNFYRYPTWRELMAPLYRSENGMANRSWGFRPDLPPMFLPTPQQLAMLPATPRSMSAAPDPQNAGAYQLFDSPHQAAISPAKDDGQGLTPAKWADYLNFIAEEAERATVD